MIRRFRSRILKSLSDPLRFFGLIVTAGVLMVFLVPPFQMPDEHTHLFKAVQLSEGKLIGHKMGATVLYPFPLVGDYLPARYAETAHNYFITNGVDKVSSRQIASDLSQPNTNDKPQATPFENTVVYPPLAYMPQALAIAITNIFTHNVLVQLYIARLAGLATAALLMALALRWLPYGKWALIAITGTPMAIVLSASVAGDAITFGLVALFIAAVLRFADARARLGRREYSILFGLAVALGLCKLPYLLVTVLSLILPAGHFMSQRHRAGIVAGLVALPLAIAGAWSAVVNHLIINVATNSNTELQLQHLIDRPYTLITTLGRTYLGDAGDYVPRGMIDLSTGFSAAFPIWFIAINFALIIMAVVCIPRVIVERRTRLLAAAIAVASFLAINFLLYITFSPVKSPIIAGLQGRYFIPLLVLLIPAGASLLPLGALNYRNLTKVIRAFIMFGVLFAVYALLRRYY